MHRLVRAVVVRNAKDRGQCMALRLLISIFTRDMYVINLYLKPILANSQWHVLLVLRSAGFVLILMCASLM